MLPFYFAAPFYAKHCSLFCSTLSNSGELVFLLQCIAHSFACFEVHALLFLFLAGIALSLALQHVAFLLVLHCLCSFLWHMALYFSQLVAVFFAVLNFFVKHFSLFFAVLCSLLSQFRNRVLNIHGHKKLFLQYCGYGKPP